MKRVREAEDGPVLLLLHASAVSARSMALPTCSFLNGLPAILASCQEILIVTDDANVEPLRIATHCALASSSAQSAKQVRFFALLDEAFSCAQAFLPHEVLDLRRQRIRSGTWATLGVVCGVGT